MEFFFWQNTNSIHQSSFLKAIAKSGNVVTLIVTEPLSERRLRMGWSEPLLENVNVIDISREKKNDWQSIIESNCSLSTLHIFSGIDAFPGVQKALDCAVNKKCNVAVLSEPMDSRGWKGKLRLLRGYWHKSKYNRKISFLLGIGDKAVFQFHRWGFHESKVFPWAYTVEEGNATLPESSGDTFSLVFVGSLIKRKGYDLLIAALEIIKDRVDFNVDFYCVDDANREEARLVQSQSSLGERLRLLNFLPNEEMRTKIADYDLLVLPSRHDGWGAVINEALTAGTPVLVSKNCGASTFVNKADAKLGEVIEDYTSEGIARQLEKAIKTGKISDGHRKYIQNWALKHISGEALASYFIEICKYSLGEVEKRPNTIWI